MAKVSKTSPKNDSEKNEDEIFRERYIFPELTQKIIDGLRIKKNFIDDLRLI